MALAVAPIDGLPSANEIHSQTSGTTLKSERGTRAADPQKESAGTSLGVR